MSNNIQIDKVKITKEQKEALDIAIKNNIAGDVLLNNIILGFYTKEYLPLSKLKPMELAKVFMGLYEVE